MKIERNDLVTFYEGLHNLSNLCGIAFINAISHNKRKLKAEYKTIQEVRSEGLKKYNKDRIELAESHSEKNEEGGPVLIYKENQETYKIIDNNLFNADLAKLQSDHKESFDELNDYMKEEIDIDVYMVKLDKVDEGITEGQYDVIYIMIDDSETK